MRGGGGGGYLRVADIENSLDVALVLVDFDSGDQVLAVLCGISLCGPVLDTHLLPLLLQL